MAHTPSDTPANPHTHALTGAARDSLRLPQITPPQMTRCKRDAGHMTQKARRMMRMGLLTVPMAFALAACDTGATGDSPRDAERGVVTAPPATDLPGEPGLAMARQACGRALAGPDGMMRVEFERPANVGAVVMLHVWPEEGSAQTRRWRCYFNYDTRRIRAIPA